jgi:hypothetical protein
MAPIYGISCSNCILDWEANLAQYLILLYSSEWFSFEDSFGLVSVFVYLHLT